MRTEFCFRSACSPSAVDTVHPFFTADGLRKHQVSYKIDDSSTPIGRRYARADELGISFAVVVDFQSLKDRTVTIRERDTTAPQVRVPVSDPFLLLLFLSLK